MAQRFPAPAQKDQSRILLFYCHTFIAEDLHQAVVQFALRINAKWQSDRARLIAA